MQSVVIIILTPENSMNIKASLVLNLHQETMELLGANIRSTLQDKGIGRDFLGKPSQPQAVKVKTHNSKLRSFCTANDQQSKGTMSRMREFLHTDMQDLQSDSKTQQQ